MNELKSAARAALQGMGEDDGPNIEDRERLRRRIFGAIATGGVTAASATALGAESATITGGTAQVTLKSALFGSKLGSLGPVVSGLAVGGLVGSVIAGSSLFLVEKVAPAPSVSTSVARTRSRGANLPAMNAAASSEAQASVASRSSSDDTPTVAPAADSAPHTAPRVDRDARVPRAPESEDSQNREAPAFAPAPAPGIREELALIEQAHRELSQGNATASLAALDEHARRFPNGAFSAERTAARVFALCALGQLERARTIGDDFLRREPNSPLVPRIRSSCAGRP
jgi:hypothetical protein